MFVTLLQNVRIMWGGYVRISMPIILIPNDVQIVFAGGRSTKTGWRSRQGGTRGEGRTRHPGRARYPDRKLDTSMTMLVMAMQPRPRIIVSYLMLIVAGLTHFAAKRTKRLQAR